VDVATMRKHRPIVVIGILVLSALLTPTDVVSQLMMGIPTYILFESSLIVAQIARLKALEKKEEEDEDDTDVDEDIPQLLSAEEPLPASLPEAESDDDDIDDEYDEYDDDIDDYDDEEWDYESYSRREELKSRKEKIRKKNRVRRIRGNS